MKGHFLLQILQIVIPYNFCGKGHKEFPPESVIKKTKLQCFPHLFNHIRKYVSIVNEKSIFWKMRSFLSWLHGPDQFPFPASKFSVLPNFWQIVVPNNFVYKVLFGTTFCQIVVHLFSLCKSSIKLRVLLASWFDFFDSRNSMVSGGTPG